MTCEEFDDLWVDLARDDLPDPIVRESARAHAAGCVRCDHRLAEARALTAELRALAEATATAQAPGSTRDAILATLRARRQLAASRSDLSRRPLPQWALGAAAAVVLAGVLLFLARPGMRPSSSPPSDAAASPETGFVPLGLAAPPMEAESFLVVRVEMSSASLASLGLPVELASSEVVRADLLLGEDGVARAIRLVD